MEQIRLAIVDDQSLFRQGIEALIQQMEEVTLLVSASGGSDLLQQLEQSVTMPEIILMDMEMPEMNGIELNRRIRALYPDIKVIMLSLYDQGRYVFKMVEEGACGYLSKNCNLEDLAEAIHKVSSSGFYFTDLIKNALQQSSDFRKKQVKMEQNTVDITNREKEIVSLICQEYTNAEIAEKLFISQRTVDGHRNNLLLKTGSKNTAGLVVYAIKNGLYEVIVR